MTSKRRLSTPKTVDSDTLNWDDPAATPAASAPQSVSADPDLSADADADPGEASQAATPGSGPPDSACDHNEATDVDVESNNPGSGLAEASSARRRGLLNLDRVVGLVVATAVGDALGWPQEDRSQILGGDAARNVQPRPEFRDWKRTAGSQYGRYTDPVFAGEYSDDTQLMLAVARACHHSDWLNWLTRIELPLWPIYQRGGGGAVLTASRTWAEGRTPWGSPNSSRSSASQSSDRVAKYFDAGANGVAMRIAPHVIVTAHDTDATLIRRVIADGIATHGHPRALLGGVIHALALRHALLQESTLGYGELLEHLLSNASWRDPSHFRDAMPPGWAAAHANHSRGETHQPPEVLWSRTCTEVEELLSIAINGLNHGATTNDQRTLTDLGVYDKKRSGAGTVTAVAAAYVAARTASRPMGGLLRSGFLRNADTDTLCSMTGALLGATQGSGWLNHLFAQVQDRDYLISIATSIASVAENLSPDTEPRPEATPKPPTAASMRRWSKSLFDGEPIELCLDGRRVSVQRISPLLTRTKQFMARAVLRTEDGQTLIIDRTSKTPIPTVQGVPHASGAEPPATPTAPSREKGQGKDQGVDAPTFERAIIAAVEIRVTDVSKTAHFLQHVFGLSVSERPNGRVDVGNLLLLCPAHNAELSAGAAPVLQLHTRDLRKTADRAESINDVALQWADDNQTLWIREPGGLRLRVTPA